MALGGGTVPGPGPGGMGVGGQQMPWYDRSTMEGWARQGKRQGRQSGSAPELTTEPTQPGGGQQGGGQADQPVVPQPNPRYGYRPPIRQENPEFDASQPISETNQQWTYGRGTYLPMSDPIRQGVQEGTATGWSVDPSTGAWVETTGRPDLIYDGHTQTAYYKGRALSPDEVRHLWTNPPQAQAAFGQALGTASRGSAWQQGQQAPQVGYRQAGPGHQVSGTGLMVGSNMIDRSAVRDVEAYVPYKDMMLGMIRDQGHIPALFDPDRQVDLERPDRINVDQIDHRDIDYTPDDRLLESLIGERTRYTEMQLAEQRDQAMENYRSEMAKRGISGGAALMAAERDVARPYNDRIAANRQQVVDQAITQFEDIRMAVAVRNRQNEIEVAKQNQQISLEQEVRNVGFLVQTIISEGDINARLGGQLAVAAVQAETARRGQSLGALASLQGLETTSALEAALANQGMDWNVVSANQQAGLQSQQANQRDATQRALADQADRTQRDLADQRAGMEADRINAQNWLNVLGLDANMVQADMQNNLNLLNSLMQDENVDADRALEAWKSFETLQLNLLAITGDLGRSDFTHDSTG